MMVSSPAVFDNCTRFAEPKSDIFALQHSKGMYSRPGSLFKRWAADYVTTLMGKIITLDVELGGNMQ